MRCFANTLLPAVVVGLLAAACGDDRSVGAADDAGAGDEPDAAAPANDAAPSIDAATGTSDATPLSLDAAVAPDATLSPDAAPPVDAAPPIDATPPPDAGPPPPVPEFEHVASVFGDVATTTERFGYKVFVDGNRVLAGAPGIPFPDGVLGAAYLFERQADGTYPLIQTFVPFDGEDQDAYGGPLAMDGSRVVVGAPMGDYGTGGDQGAVYLYEEVAGTWSTTKILNPDYSLSLDHFGSRVALEGDLLVVTAPNHTHGDPRSLDWEGAVYFYERDATTGTWMLKDELLGTDGDLEVFGETMALMDGTVFVGTSQLFAPGVGRIHVFERDVAGDWQRVDIIAPTDMPPFSDEALYIQDAKHGMLAARADYGGPDTTIVLFERDAAGNWVQTARIFEADLASGSLGAWLSIGADFILASDFRYSPPLTSGQALILQKIGDAWVETASIRAPSPAAQRYFSIDIGMDGDIAAIPEDEHLEEPGVVHIYERE